MPTLWNKTLFYLGLADEDENGIATVVSPGGEVREVPPESVGMGTGEARAPYTTSVVKPGMGIVGRRVEPPAASRQPISDDRTYVEAGVYIRPNTGPAATTTEPESHIIVARNFSDAQALADSVAGGRSVVLDLRTTEPEMVRRIVDFASGLIYALHGKMAKTSQGVIIVTPSGVSIGAVEQERLAALGLFDTDV